MIDVLSPPQLSVVVPDGFFSAEVSIEGDHHVVRLTGELDNSSRSFLVQTCIAEDRRVVVVEMAALTFMDCSGYSAFISARHVLEQRNGSLTLANSVGEPAYLLSLIDKVDDHRWDAPSSALS